MLLFANIALVDESKDGVKVKLKRWWEGLESNCFKINHIKIEYIDYNFNGHIQRDETTVRIETQEIPQRDSLYYLGLIISKDEEINEDIKHRIKAGWLKWRLTSGVLCDRRMPTRLKEMFYKTSIRPTMTFGTEC